MCNISVGNSNLYGVRVIFLLKVQGLFNTIIREHLATTHTVLCHFVMNIIFFLYHYGEIHTC